ncbi:MAG: ATP-dependent Clp protease adaptor ClpS [Phycisphaeraceae bacterium]|nr:ATP-dependent Clp protease adaptor ClpS [Phycisphaeraceae bacterium]
MSDRVCNQSTESQHPSTPAEGAAEVQGRVAVAEKPAPAKKRGPVDTLPQFKVLLHNDSVNSIDHVVDSIVELTPLDHGRAVEVTLEANSSGVALVLVTHQERAELYRDQFQSKKLTVTIESGE